MMRARFEGAVLTGELGRLSLTEYRLHRRITRVGTTLSR
jgi:hypothetical protein